MNKERRFTGGSLIRLLIGYLYKCRPNRLCKQINVMKITQLFTNRNAKGQNYAQPIIYEWEDVIINRMGLSIVGRNIFQKIANFCGIRTSLVCPFINTFRFVGNGRHSDAPMNSKHIVPCIIDFFEQKEQLPEFYTKHSKNPLVLLSSPFDYEYLKRNNCPLNIGLFAYSIADKYGFENMNIEKKYDIVLTGRQDPLLYSFFKEYILKHPNVTYVKRGQSLENDDKKDQPYYLNGKEIISDLTTRDDFMRLQAQGRVTLYGVQGYDNRTKDFFHMTPHFLEIIASGSHVLARYPTDERGVDARFYEFDKFSPSIECYDEFEKAMDIALQTDVDRKMYFQYLQKHFTSTRVRELENLLCKI